MKLNRIGTSVAVIILLMGAGGCIGALVPVVDLKEIPHEKLERSYKIQIYALGGSTPPPIEAHLGEASAYSCKNLLWDPPATKGNALTQLKLLALDMGADGVIDVTFDSQGTDTYGTNCWSSVNVTGLAVKFRK